MKIEIRKLIKAINYLKDAIRNSNDDERNYESRIRRIFYEQLWQKTADSLGISIKDIGNNFYKLYSGERATVVWFQYVMYDNPVIFELAGNKPLVYKLLQEHHIPVPNHLIYEETQINEAFHFLKNCRKKCVVKPAKGTGGGKGITTNIDSFKTLKKATFKASLYDSQILIEEQIEGDSYRLLFLNGKLLNIIKREPPSVRGDGRQSIRSLILQENERRKKQGINAAVSLLNFDDDCLLTLKEQGMDLKYILPSDEKIRIRNVVNNNSNQENISIPQEQSLGILGECREALRVLPVQLAGIDIITKNLNLSLAESGGIINEINTTPGFHFHYLIKNKSAGVDVAKIIIQSLLNARDK